MGILTSIALIFSTAGSIATAGQQFLSIWQSVKGLLPRADPEEYFDQASGEGKRVSTAIRNARMHLDVTAPFAKELFKQSLLHTAIVSVLSTVLLSAAVLASLAEFHFGPGWGTTLEAAISFLFGVGTTQVVWRIAPPGRLKAITNTERVRAESTHLDGSATALQEYFSKAVSSLEKVRASQGGQLFQFLRGLSVIEYEFLALFVELQSQIRSLETWRYIKGLRTLESELHEATVEDVFSILAHVIEELVTKGTLTRRPQTQAEQWRITQAKVLREEFTRIGFVGWLEEAGDSFASLDFAEIVAAKKLRLTLNAYLRR